MTSRTEYEAWFEREYPVDEGGARRKYRETMVQELMFSAWQAAERQALERAAEICDATEAEYEDSSPQHAGGAMQCALSIRALNSDSSSVEKTTGCETSSVASKEEPK